MAATNVWTNSFSPGTYTTGGFTVVTSLSTVKAFDLLISTRGANLGQVQFQTLLDNPSSGQVTIKILRRNFDKLSLGSPTGLPSGVTAPSTSGQTVASESSHTHAADHDHAISAASATMSGGSGQVTQAVTGGVNTSTHTHTVNLANLAVTSGAGSSHNHTWDNIYQHQHSITDSATDIALSEIANGTNLSGTTLVGIGADQ